MKNFNMVVVVSLSGFGLIMTSMAVYFQVFLKIMLIEINVYFSGGLNLSFPIFLDSMSLFFSGTVCTIALAVFYFSMSYMKNEKYFVRFHLLVLAFISSMLLLILSPNLISVLLGWDGLGVTSFLLVIYFQSAKSSNAGVLTVMTNRLGDILILLVIAKISTSSQWSVFFTSEMFNWETPTYLFLMMVLAAFTKSAQLPFSAWLPAAMAAPTPVSALVHSSTLVTAGVYLLTRLTLSLSNISLQFFMLVVGTLTMLMAGVTALFEMDMKKIVALSTLSQLGLMVASLGLGLWKMAFIHLLAHAFFKALLFMAVGSMIHLSLDYQDLRKASVSTQSAHTLSFVMISNLSLCGTPFLSGFFSKDLILETLASSNSNFLIITGFYFAVFLTSAYSTRFTFLCWLVFKRPSSLGNELDEDFLILKACLILWPLALTGGVFIGFFASQFPWSFNLSMASKNFALFSVILGAGFGLVFCKFYKVKKTLPILWSWGFMWTSPALLSSAITPPFLQVSGLIRDLDLSSLDFLSMTSFLGNYSVFGMEGLWRGAMPVNALITSLTAIMATTMIYKVN